MIKLKEKPVCVSKPSSVYLVLDSDSIHFIELLDVMNIYLSEFFSIDVCRPFSLTQKSRLNNPNSLFQALENNACITCIFMVPCVSFNLVCHLFTASVYCVTVTSPIAFNKLQATV